MLSHRINFVDFIEKHDCYLSLPEIDSDEELQHDAPWETVVTMKGDVNCRFKIKSFSQDDETEEFVHLMRPMLPSTVTMLKTSGVMWNSLEEESLLDTLGHFRQILDEMTTRPYWSRP